MDDLYIEDWFVSYLMEDFLDIWALDSIEAAIISARMETTAFRDSLPAFRSIYVERISWSMESTCPV